LIGYSLAMSKPEQAAQSESAPLPSIRRRLAAFTYEGVMLFGVLMISAYLFSSLTQQRHALQLRWGLMGYLFVVLGIYFVWFWTHGGQTVAMRAWHIRIVDAAGAPLTQTRAFLRYAASYIWFLPGLGIAASSGLQGGKMLLPLLLNVVLVALLARFSPGRQFPHDLLSGTRLVTQYPQKK
jgi:uncharacterized RDD family membrane protein YckC